MKVELFTVGPFQENTYVLWDEETKKTFIIDPGGENRRVLSYLERNGLSAEAIINTHGHVDHIAGVRELQETLNVPFMIHPDDEIVVKHASESAAFFGMSFEGIPQIDDYLEDGQILTLGKNEIKVLHTPGHSPGGVCFLTGEDVFVGDTLFAMSVGRSDLPGGSHRTLIDSIRTRLLVLDDHFRAHPGHGPGTTIGQERRMNPFLS